MAASAAGNEGFYIDLFDNTLYDPTSVFRPSSMSTVRVEHDSAGMLALNFSSKVCTLQFGFGSGNSENIFKGLNDSSSEFSGETKKEAESEDGIVKKRHYDLRSVHQAVFGPVKMQSLAGSKYTLVIVDELSRYTRFFFLRKKSDAADEIIVFIKRMENLNDTRVKELRSDNDTEFRNSTLEEYYTEHGISRNFSSARTPEQNGAVERKNRTLIEAARTMLNGARLPSKLWAEAVSTVCFTQNRTIVNKRLGKTAYQILRVRKPNINFFHVFGFHVFILNNKDQLGKFDTKADDVFFVGYSTISKAFRVFNIRKQTIEESYHVTFDESSEALKCMSKSGDNIEFKEVFARTVALTQHSCLLTLPLRGRKRRSISTTDDTFTLPFGSLKSLIMIYPSFNDHNLRSNIPTKSLSNLVLLT